MNNEREEEEDDGSRKSGVRLKAERQKQKAEKKSEVRSTKSEEENNSLPAGQAGAFDIPKSEIKELQTGNSKLPTENTMEVHHHPNLEKKGLQEYLLEGLMIFLAVFMGFVAENIREHVADSTRETEYMESLVKDLRLDTAILDRSAVLKEQRILAIDSILQYFRTNMKAKKVPLSTYAQMRRAQWDMFFIHHGGTVDQLKNSGGLRLIRVKGIVDSIESYYQKVQRSESRNTVYFDNQQVSDALTEKLWDAGDDIKYYQDYISVHKPLPDSGSVAINALYLNEYLNNLVRVKWITSSDRWQFTIDLKNNANRLIALIKKEYQLE